MDYKLCPKCQINYITDDNELCSLCSAESKRVVSRSRGAMPESDLPRRNIAFKCNYCDGGANCNGIGFNGICSDAVLEYNVKNKSVCGKQDGLCYAYARKRLDRARLDGEFASDNYCACYESRLLTSWQMGAGETLHGDKPGTPNKLLGVRTNSLCVLTTQEPDASSAERYIFGVFLVSRSDEGDDDTAGNVCAHEKYRIILDRNEAHKMPFWNYYRNNSEKAPMQWGTGLFRYLDDSAAIAILKDIAELKTNEKEKELAKEFLDYFVAVNELNIE